MSGRPEATDGGYHDVNDPYSQDAWQEFTPWRLGDPSTVGEAPPSYAVSHTQPDGWSQSVDRRPEPVRPSRHTRGEDTVRDSGQRPGRWWTEDVPEKYKPGDQVRSSASINSRLGMQHVPNNTKGQVISTRLGVLGGEYATVRFDNGYTNEIDISAIERRSWWD